MRVTPIYSFLTSMELTLERFLMLPGEIWFTTKIRHLPLMITSMFCGDLELPKSPTTYIHYACF